MLEDEDQGQEVEVEVENTSKPEDKKQDEPTVTLTELSERISSLKHELSTRDSSISKLSKKLKEIEREKLSDEELLELKATELAEREKQFQEKETAWREEKLRNYASSQLLTKGYLNNLTTDEIASIQNMVLGKDEQDVDAKVAALDSTLKKLAKAQYSSSAAPSITNTQTTTAGINPWLSDQLSVTEQHKIMKSDPERAKALKAAASKL